MAHTMTGGGGEELARRSLRLDAAYCFVAGSLVGARSRRVAVAVDLPVEVVRGVGAATLSWAEVVRRLADAEDWRRSATIVAGVNVMAAAGLAAVGQTRTRGLARWVTWSVAADVAAFGVSQIVALLTDGQGPPVE